MCSSDLAAHADSSNEEAHALIAEARALIEALPITEEQSLDPAYADVFQVARKSADTEVVGRQAEVEQEWDSFTVDNYRRARELAEQAASL